MIDTTRTAAFIGKVQKLAKNHGRLVFTGGTSNQENIVLELYKQAATLATCMDDMNKFTAQSGQVEGKLRIAQATNVIGDKEFEELQEELWNLTNV